MYSVGSERQTVGAFDTRLQQQLLGLGDVSRVLLEMAVAERDRRMGRGLGDTVDRGRGPAVEDREVLERRNPVGGLVELAEVDVIRAAIAVGELGARDAEGSAHLHQREDTSLRGTQTVDRRLLDSGGAAKVRGGVLPALRPLEVDELARRERGAQPLARLVVEQRSSRRR